MAITFCSSALQFEKAAVGQFENVSRVSSPSWAQIRKGADSDSKVFVVESVWNQRDLAKNEKRRFKKCSLLCCRSPDKDGLGEIENLGETYPTEMSNIDMMSISPSGKYTAVLKNEDESTIGSKSIKKQYLEIWQNDCLLHCTLLSSTKKHGTVFDDVTFGVLEWSPTEDRLLFIAERDRPKAISYFDKDDKSSAGDCIRGSEHLWNENWGDQLTTHHCPVPVVFNLETQECKVVDDIPSDLSVGQAIWGRDNNSLVFVGWNNEPRRLGLVAFTNRKCALYYWHYRESNLCKLSAEDASVRSPRLNPDKTKLVYLESKLRSPHESCAKLVMVDFDTLNRSTLVDIVHCDAEGFPGLYIYSLPTRCWSQDGSKIVLSSVWHSTKEILCVDVSSGTVSKISPGGMIGCWSVMDVFDDVLVFSFASPVCSPSLMVGMLSYTQEAGSFESSVQIKNITTIVSSRCNFTDDLTWEILSLKPSAGGVDNNISYEAILVKPISAGGFKPPLLVTPHGGPHTCYVADFMIDYVALCLLGFAVLLVNYRGSIGFGQGSIDALLGNIGTMDVLDVQDAAAHVIQSRAVDPTRVVILGDSHGGFITTHLIGRFPDFYKAACVRNPVIDVAAMVRVSDVPDWSFAENDLLYNPWTTLLTENSLAKMFHISPIKYADKIKSPVLFIVGENDLRVPPASQSRELYFALKARRVETKMLAYDKSCHPLSEVDVEADAFVNMAVWFYNHLYATNEAA